MPEIAATIVGVTSLALVILSALALVKWGTTSTEMTAPSRDWLFGCGFAMLALGVLGCVVAFAVMVARLTKGL